MKYLIMILMGFGFFMAKAKTDSAVQGRMDLGNIKCAKIDINSIACYTDDVDKNDDGFVDAEEWNDADI